MEEPKIAGLEYSSWAQKAKEEPENFEMLRLQAIEQFFESVPEEKRERLRRLQWRIDQERRLAKTPMAGCIRLSQMMWRSVLGEGGIRERFMQLAELLQSDGETPSTTPSRYAGAPADVLAFAPKKD